MVLVLDLVLHHVVQRHDGPHQGGEVDDEVHVVRLHQEAPGGLVGGVCGGEALMVLNGGVWG